MRTFLVFVFFWLLSFHTHGQIQPFDQVTPTGDQLQDEVLYFHWQLGDQKLSLRDDGTLFVGKKIRIRLPKAAGFQPGFSITRMSVGTSGSAIFLAYETESAGDSYSHICRLDKNIQAVVWCKEIMSDFHPAVGKESIWVGAIQLMAKLSPETGKFSWRHQGTLKGHTNTTDTYCPSAETESIVTFYALPNGYRDASKVITFDRSSGKLISVLDAKQNAQCPK